MSKLFPIRKRECVKCKDRTRHIVYEAKIKYDIEVTKVKCLECGYITDLRGV